MSDLVGLLLGVALGYHDVIGDVLDDGDLTSDRHIVLLVDRDLDGYLDILVFSLSSDGSASALGVAAATVPLALASALLLVAAACVLDLLGSSDSLVVHDSLLDGPPRLLDSGLGHI